VAGAIVLGAPDAAATITQLYDRGVRPPSDRLALLLADPCRRPRTAPRSAGRRGGVPVQHGQQGAAGEGLRGGARGVAELAETTRATTGCGSCRDAVAESPTGFPLRNH